VGKCQLYHSHEKSTNPVVLEQGEKKRRKEEPRADQSKRPKKTKGGEGGVGWGVGGGVGRAHTGTGGTLGKGTLAFNPGGKWRGKRPKRTANVAGWSSTYQRVPHRQRGHAVRCWNEFLHDKGRKKGENSGTPRVRDRGYCKRTDAGGVQSGLLKATKGSGM